MPDMNMSVFEEVKRNQLVTEVDIQTQVALDDYQVQLPDIVNPTQSQDNVVIDRHGEFLPHWNESLDFDTWVKMSMEVAGKRLLMLRGNSSVSSESHSDNVFILFDDFSNLSKWNAVGTVSVASNEMLITGNVNWNSNGVYSTKSIQVPFILEYDMRISSATNPLAYLGYSINTLNTNTGIYMYPNLPTSMYKVVEGSVSSVSSYVTAALTPVKLITTNPGFKMYYNDALITTDTSWANTNSADRINFQVYENIIYYFSNLRVRKYTATEPTYNISTSKNISTALKLLGRVG